MPLQMTDYTFLSSFGLYLKTKYRIKPNTTLTYHKHLEKVLNTAIAGKCFLKFTGSN